MEKFSRLTIPVKLLKPPERLVIMQVSRIRLHKKKLGVLSPLEMDVLTTLWKRQDGMRVRDIYSALKNKRKVALTSVAVILDRLYEKKIVKRGIETGRGGEHYIYSCRISQKDFEKSVIDKTVNKLIENFGPIAVNYFNERFSKKSG